MRNSSSRKSFHVMKRALPRLLPSFERSQCIRVKRLQSTAVASISTRSLSQFGGKPQPIAGPSWARGYSRQVPVPQTKSISQTEYELRRTLLVDNLPEGSVCVLIGAGIKYASDSVLYSYEITKCSDSSYPFHQDPNFFYLTGFVEKNALGVIGI